MAAAESVVDCKLLLIGNTSVGKSSLLLQFTDKQWLPERAATTVGSAIRVHSMEFERKNVRLSIWDTAGQEKYRALASSYYRGAQGAILVYDVSNRDSLEALLRWNGELETYVSESVVKIVVGNKVDEESSREVSTFEGEAFARRMNALFIETSAKTAVGVSETFREVVEKILDTPELWTPSQHAGTSDSMPDGVDLNPNKPQSRGGCAC